MASESSDQHYIVFFVCMLLYLLLNVEFMKLVANEVYEDGFMKFIY